MARASVAVAVLVALAVPVGAPWSEGSEEVAVVVAPAAAPVETAAVRDSSTVLEEVPPVPLPPAASGSDPCQLGLLVTVSGWTKHAIAYRSLDVGVGLQEGQLAVSVTGGPLIETPDLLALADLGLLLPEQDVAADVVGSLGHLQGLAEVDAGVSFEEVYYQWTPTQLTFFVDASAVGPLGLPLAVPGVQGVDVPSLASAGVPVLSAVSVELCGEDQALFDPLPEDLVAFVEGLANFGHDGWYTVVAPEASLGLAVDGQRLV